jgi:hypothetical protein
MFCGETVKNGDFSDSEDDAIDAVVLYFQSTPNFPSWTSERVLVARWAGSRNRNLSRFRSLCFKASAECLMATPRTPLSF